MNVKCKGFRGKDLSGMCDNLPCAGNNGWTVYFNFEDVKDLLLDDMTKRTNGILSISAYLASKVITFEIKEWIAEQYEVEENEDKNSLHLLLVKFFIDYNRCYFVSAEDDKSVYGEQS